MIFDLIQTRSFPTQITERVISGTFRFWSTCSPLPELAASVSGFAELPPRRLFIRSLPVCDDSDTLEERLHFHSPCTLKHWKASENTHYSCLLFFFRCCLSHFVNETQIFIRSVKGCGTSVLSAHCCHRWKKKLQGNPLLMSFQQKIHSVYLTLQECPLGTLSDVD